MDRILDAIAAISCDHAREANKRDGTAIDDYISKSLLKIRSVIRHKDQTEDIRREMDQSLRLTRFDSPCSFIETPNRQSASEIIESLCEIMMY